MSLSSAQRRRAAQASLSERIAASRIPYAPAVAAEVAQSEQRIVARLQRDVYLNFEKGIPVVGSVPSNEHEAGFLAGAEYVLRKLRTEIVMGE